ncbi:uncharacterized protein [Odocoileus virginianus]|uniref:Uncharacterized protein n=1 Tax=Odocoileus virginianus TaxID=9874 RepID=A0ABM4J5G6_ODOVR
MAGLAALAGPVFPTRLLLFLISTVSAVFCGHLVKDELSRFLVRADGLLPNPFLPGVHLEDRLEPHSRAVASASPCCLPMWLVLPSDQEMGSRPPLGCGYCGPCVNSQ